MRVMSVIPGRPGSALIAESPDPPPAEGAILVGSQVMSRSRWT